MSDEKIKSTLTPYFALAAEGGRIGLASCRECGAVILLGDDAFDAPKVHAEWHTRQPRPDKFYRGPIGGGR